MKYPGSHVGQTRDETVVAPRLLCLYTKMIRCDRGETCGRQKRGGKRERAVERGKSLFFGPIFA